MALLLVQPIGIMNQICPEGFQVNVENRFFQIKILLPHDRFESVLKKLPAAPVPLVETDDISG